MAARLTTDNGHIVTKLQSDVISLSTFVERADKNITKLTEVSSRISELLAVQGARLDTQEKTSDQLQDLLEKRRQEYDNNIKDVYVRVEKMEKDIYKEIDDTYNKVLTEIKEMRVEGNKQHAEMKNKVERLEKWMWTVMGGFTVALFVFEVFVKQAI
jgi:ABC-type transporter Mla subunit MlaD